MQLNHLISESISVIRESALIPGERALLFSGGKDSITLLHLLRMAFWPAPIPFSLLHVDTGHNFPEINEFLEKTAKEFKIRLLRQHVQDLIESGEVEDPTGYYRSRNQIQSFALKRALRIHSLNTLIGGARRDEEKARAKQKIFSLRNKSGEQTFSESTTTEFWNIYNSYLPSNKTMRIFPLCHWTELDVWSFIDRYQISVPSLYFSHQRTCVIKQDGSLLPHHPCVMANPEDPVIQLPIRFRTIGDMTCSLGCRSLAKTPKEVIEEIARSSQSERGVRADDQFSTTSMEDRRRQGYF